MAPTADCALALLCNVGGLEVTALLQACVAKVMKLTVQPTTTMESLVTLQNIPGISVVWKRALLKCRRLMMRIGWQFEANGKRGRLHWTILHRLYKLYGFNILQDMVFDAMHNVVLNIISQHFTTTLRKGCYQDLKLRSVYVKYHGQQVCDNFNLQCI